MLNEGPKKPSAKDEIKKRIRPSVHKELIEAENVNENNDVNVYGKKRTKKLKFEDRFVRHTSYIEKELLEKLNKAAGGEKGEKTRIINEALHGYLEQ